MRRAAIGRDHQIHRIERVQKPLEVIVSHQHVVRNGAHQVGNQPKVGPLPWAGEKGQAHAVTVKLLRQPDPGCICPAIVREAGGHAKRDMAQVLGPGMGEGGKQARA